VTITVTTEAAEVLVRSLELAGVDAKHGGIRLRGARTLGGGFDVQVEMAQEPLGGDLVIDAGPVRLFVDPQVTEAIPDAIVTLEPQHERLVVRPREPG